MEINTKQEKNLILGTVEKSDSNIVDIYLSVPIAAVNSPELTASALLYTDNLTAGTKNYTREQIQQKLRSLGSQIEASYSAGKITIQITTLTKKLKPTLGLFKDILTADNFKPAELKRAKQTLKNQAELAKENARAVAHRNLNNSIITNKDLRYDHQPEDIIFSTDKVKLSDLKQIHQVVLNSQWTLTLGGSKASIDTALNTLKKLKQNFRSDTLTTTLFKTLIKNKKTVLTESIPSKQNLELSLGMPLPLCLDDKDFPAFQFGLTVLGKWGSFAGRLMSTVRKKEGLTYGIYAQTLAATKDQTGYWRIMTFFAPKDVKQGVTSTLREINNISTKGITESEWLRFKEILKTEEKLTNDSQRNTTALVHKKLLMGRSWKEYQEFKKKLQSCTVKEVNTALKKYLDTNKIIISIAGPINKAKTDIAKI